MSPPSRPYRAPANECGQRFRKPATQVPPRTPKSTQRFLEQASVRIPAPTRLGPPSSKSGFALWANPPFQNQNKLAPEAFWGSTAVQMNTSILPLAIGTRVPHGRLARSDSPEHMAWRHIIGLLMTMSRTFGLLRKSGSLEGDGQLD